MTKTVAITGAGGALAEAVVKAFNEAGWNLALFAHRSDTVQSLRQSYAESVVVQVDLSNEAEVNKGVGRVLETYDRIDALLNLAGGFAKSGATDTSMQALDKQLTLNFKTAFNATRAVLPGMLEHSSGVIVGVGAKPAQGGAAKMGPYAASKAALITYLESVRAEVESKGVWVSLLYPMGTIDTPANRDSMPTTDPEIWLAPQELAESILYIVTRSTRGRIKELRVYPPS